MNLRPQLQQLWHECWKPPQKLKPSEWAGSHRVLNKDVSAEPGKFRNDRTPYAAGVMDCVIEPGVEEIWWVAGTQISKTTTQENILGYWIDNDPGPCLIVKPTEQACDESVRERWRPLIDGSPALARHKTGDPHDNKLRGIS